MENCTGKRIIDALETLRNSGILKEVKNSEVNKWIKVTQRLASFSCGCKECNHQLEELEHIVLELIKKNGQFIKSDFIPIRKKVNNLMSHLHKQHKIITEGHYLNSYLPIGVSLGLLYGLSVMDNLALGMGIGLSIGIAIGAGLDSDAKKKGITL